MKETYRFFVDAGADIVINHHQHCYSGYEVYNKKPIFYGLGNFSFDWEGKRNTIWNEGYMVSLWINNGKIDFKLIPYIQGNDIPGINLIDVEKQDEFYKRIDKLNAIISDDLQLNAEHQKFMNTTSLAYKITLEPYRNKYLTALYARHLLPFLLSKKKLLNMLNFIQCEAHQERTINMLLKNINRTLCK